MSFDSPIRDGLFDAMRRARHGTRHPAAHTHVRWVGLQIDSQDMASVMGINISNFSSPSAG